MYSKNKPCVYNTIEPIHVFEICALSIQDYLHSSIIIRNVYYKTVTEPATSIHYMYFLPVLSVRIISTLRYAVRYTLQPYE